MLALSQSVGLERRFMDPATTLWPIVQKLSSYGIGGIFLGYLIWHNWLLLRRIENLEAKHEVGTEKTVHALGKVAELLAALKEVVHARGH